MLIRFNANLSKHASNFFNFFHQPQKRSNANKYPASKAGTDLDKQIVAPHPEQGSPAEAPRQPEPDNLSLISKALSQEPWSHPGTDKLVALREQRPKDFDRKKIYLYKA